MGGNLFKLPRMSRLEYILRENRLRSVLDDVLGPECYAIPRWIASKTDFGDMDVVVRADGEPWDQLSERLVSALQPEQVVQTGDCLSMLLDGLQTDFFARGEAAFRFAPAFMSWGDLGQILGKLFRRYDCKYGQNGLRVGYRGFRAKLMVSQDMDTILDILELDSAAWHRGFSSEPELWEWVTGSPWFFRKPFLGDESGKERRRSKGRPGMARFATWLRERPGIGSRRSSVESFRERLARCTGVDVAAWVAEQSRVEMASKEVAGRFNGRLIMELRPELSGKALGTWIRGFKSDRSDSEAGFREWVLERSPEEIRGEILSFEG